jgi:hypothetical protein
MTFRVSHWDTLDYSRAFFVSKGNIFLRIPMASDMCLHFGMQEENTPKQITGKYHLCTL